MSSKKNVVPRTTQEGVNQEVIDNVQGPTTGNEPTPLPATTPTVSITDALELLMSIMEQAPGGSIQVCNEEGAQLNIAIPKALPRNLAEPMAAPTDG